MVYNFCIFIIVIILLIWLIYRISIKSNFGSSNPSGTLEVKVSPSGFFSNSGTRLQRIIEYVNAYEKLPKKIAPWNKEGMNRCKPRDTIFCQYKPDNWPPGKDLTYEFFEHFDNVDYPINLTKKVKFGQNDWQFGNYLTLPYQDITPFIIKFFTPSLNVRNKVSQLESKYNIHDYKNICVLFYRGTTKTIENPISDYDSYLRVTKNLTRSNPNIKYLIQTDEHEFIERMTKEFPHNSFYFKDETTQAHRGTKVEHFNRITFEYQLWYNAIMIVMSKCGYIIHGSCANSGVWIMYYRGHSKNCAHYGFSGKWII